MARVPYDAEPRRLRLRAARGMTGGRPLREARDFRVRGLPPGEGLCSLSSTSSESERDIATCGLPSYLRSFSDKAALRPRRARTIFDHLPIDQLHASAFRREHVVQRKFFRGDRQRVVGLPIHDALHDLQGGAVDVRELDDAVGGAELAATPGRRDGNSVDGDLRDESPLRPS